MKRLSYLLPLTLCITLLCLVMKTNAQEATLRLEILNGHSGGGVLSVAVSSDGKFALTGSTDKTALLWDLKTGKQLRRFFGYHEDAVSCVQFSKDGRFVLTASYDSTAQLWETATGKRVHGFGENRGGMIVKHSGKILSCAVSADMKFVATAGEDKTARIWDFETGKQLFQIEHEGRVNSIAFSPDSKLLLTGGEDKIARLYSTANGKEEKQFVGHAGEIKSVAYSPDGKQLLTGSIDKTARLWSVERQREVKKLGFDASISTVTFTPSGTEIVVGGSENKIHFWNITLEKESHKISSSTVSVAITPDEKYLISASGPEFDPMVSIQSIFGKDRRHLEGESYMVLQVAVSPNVNTILVGGEGLNNVAIWNLIKGQQKRILDADFVDSSVTYSLDGSRFGIADGLTAEVFDSISQDSKFLYHNTFNWVVIELAPDGRKLLIGNGDGGNNNGDVLLWDVETNTEIRQFKGHQKGINGLVFSPSGKIIATASTDKTVRLWNAENGEVKHIIKDFSAPVWGVAFSPDGKTIATASGGEIDMTKVGIGNAAIANSVRLFDVETGKEIERFGGEFKLNSNKFSGYKTVAYSPDGKYIAGGSFDGKVILRNNETKEIRKFEGHTDTVNSVKFAKDANGNLLIVSGSSDSTTRIWNASTGEEICALVTFRDGNWAVVQTKTGRYDAPNGGEIDGIQWVYGNETIELKQLKDIYYTPKLLPRLLGYNKEPLAKVPDLKNLKLFPKILEQTLDEKNARLTVRLQNRGGGIGPVRIAVNGKTVTEDARDEKLKANPFVENAVVTFDLKGSAFVSGKENKIEVFTNNYDAETKKGYISSRGSESLYTVKKTAEIKPPTLYAIIGGVSDYTGSNIDLKFASKDAEDMATAVSLGAKRLFGTDKIKMTVLSTSGLAGTVLPTKENFKKAFEEVAKNAQPDDILFIYLSGHGVSLGLNTDTYFYLTQEAQSASKEALNNPDVRDATAISSTELTEWLTMREWVAGEKGIKAMKQVMVLDTCASGVAQEQFNLIAKKELSSDQVRAIERLKDRTGFFVLMGSTADAPSYEASRYGQGILTYTLLQGMRGAALRDDEYIDVQKLFQYAADEVPKLAANVGGIQRPIISMPLGGASFDLGQLKTDDRKSVPIAAVKPILLRPRFSTGEEGDDTLGLIEGLSKKLEEASYANTRSGERKEASIVYIREGDLPGGIRVTGTYTIEGNIVKIKAFLRRDGKTIATLPEISVMKEKILEELLDAVHSELSKINDEYR